MLREQFAGATKVSASWLSPFERRLASIVLPKIPARLETHHLTLLTLLWCALVLVFSYLARADVRWLWMVSAAIVLQYVTDFFDGKVGKFRNTGLVKWGFYMDHLLDYLFMCSLLVGYSLIVPEQARYQMLFMLAVFGGFMVNSFLTFAATNKFRISHLKFGPTEFRIALIIANALISLFGAKLFVKALPYVTVGGFVALYALVYRTQKKIWQADMQQRDAVSERG